MRKDKQRHFLVLLFTFVCVIIIVPGCDKDKAQFLDALVSHDWQKAQTILDQHPNFIHIRLKSGGTLLHAAVYYESKEMLEFLIKNGANVNATSKDDDETPLHLAAIMGRCEMAILLLENGADVNYRDDGLATPLHLACLYSTEEMVNLLLSHGAEVDAKTEFGKTPLCYAIERKDENKDVLGIIKKLLENGADPNANCFSIPLIQAAVGFDYFKKAQLLEDYGAKLEVETDVGVKIFTVKEYQKIEQEEN